MAGKAGFDYAGAMTIDRSRAATPGRLVLRLAGCQLIGTAVGLAVVAANGVASGRPPTTDSYLQDWAMAMLLATGFGIPFFAACLLILLWFARPILRRPFLWAVIPPAILLALSLWTFRIGIDGIVLIPFCATFSGVAFVAWQRIAPLRTSAPGDPRRPFNL
jgi:hypothetical protein